MKLQKPLRNVFFGYVSIQLLAYAGPSLFLYWKTGNSYWGWLLAVFYLLNQVPNWLVMKRGIPQDVTLPAFMAPPKNSGVTMREAYLRWKLMGAYKAMAVAYGMLLFGAEYAYGTNEALIGAIIGTVGIFCLWQALLGVRFFAHTP